MAFGNVNVPGRTHLEHTRAEAALAARLAKVEQTIKDGVASLDQTGKVPEAQLPSLLPFVVGTTPPADTKKFWIDTTPGSGGLKFHHGGAWVHVPVAYT